MPPRNRRIRVEDILDAIAKIRRYTRGMTRDESYNDELVQDAVLRNFAVIGEATRYLPPEFVALYPEKSLGPPWARMRGMRNVVVHEYSGVDLRIVWDTLEEDLPQLVPVLRDILEQER